MKCRNAVTTFIKKSKSSFETNLTNNIKNDPSLFWKYVMHNPKVQNDVLAITKNNGSTTSFDYETTNSMNSFSSVFTDESLTNIPTLGDRSNDSYLNRISITVT